MLQLFLKPSQITPAKWEAAYQRIRSIAEHFPTRLVRLESYPKYEGKLDKQHFNVVVDKNTPNEHISFWGDEMSFTGRGTIRFYKNWDKHLESASYGKEVDESKPVTWFTDTQYRNDGSVPEANGVMNGYIYWETEGVHYESAITAMGTVLENMLPGAAFIAALRSDDDIDIPPIMEWLTVHFNEKFDPPLYFDKPRLLQSFINHYDKKEEAVCRMAHLYRQQHKRIMEFSVEHIGYEPTFEFYTKALADDNFGTFGFSDVLMPWIAVTQDLEATLNLISASKNWLSRDPSNERNIKRAEEYDLTDILEDLLNSYVLWTPVQREQLQHFYTNEEALETGSEDLFGTMRRMTGYRVDICPFYADEQELFEAFMYHEPKRGKEFKQMIEDWKAKNEEKYEELKQQLEEAFNAQTQQAPKPKTDPEQVAQDAEQAALIQNFVKQYAPHERYFVEKAIKANPFYMQIDEAVHQFKERVKKAIKNHDDQTYIDFLNTLSKEKHIRFIKDRLREISCDVHADFEEWLDAVQNDDIMVYLHVATALKLYDRASHFARFRLLWDNGYWREW